MSSLFLHTSSCFSLENSKINRLLGRLFAQAEAITVHSVLNNEPRPLLKIPSCVSVNINYNQDRHLCWAGLNKISLKNTAGPQSGECL